MALYVNYFNPCVRGCGLFCITLLFSDLNDDSYFPIIDQNNVDLPLVFGLLVGNLIKSSSDVLLVEPDECQNELNRDNYNT